MLFGGPLFGSLVDSHPAHTPIFLLFGGVMIALGYSMTAWTYTHVQTPHFMIIALYFLCIGIGSASCYHSALATNYRNWPQNLRSIAVGITVGCFGLSAFGLSQLSRNFQNSQNHLDVSYFLFFVAAMAFGINLVCAFTFKSHNYRRGYTAVDSQHSEVLFEATSDIAQSDTSHGTQNSPERPVSVNDFQDPLNDNALILNRTDTESAQIFIDDTSCFSSTSAYLIAFTMFSVAGTGLMYINNVGAILVALTPVNESLSTELHDAQRLHVSMLSLVSFSARILVGLLADVAYIHLKLPYSVWSIFASAVMSLAFLLSLYAKSSSDLIYVTILVGTAFGCIWTITPVLVGRYFGQRRFAKNWGWMVVMPGFGGQLFSYLFGVLYDTKGSSQSFLASHEIAMWFCVVGIFTSLSLLKTRNIGRQHDD